MSLLRLARAIILGTVIGTMAGSQVVSCVLFTH